jgi:cobalamin biosynthesis Mg chelatase CobN
MTATKHTLKILLAVTCCLFIVLVPLSVTASAQNVLQKGAQGVQKGVETGVDKTKEGTQATGHAIKKGVTGEDTSTSTERMKSTEQQTTPGTEQQTTPSTQRQTTTRESQRSSTTTTEEKKNKEQLPKTAGELPLLGLIGALALGAAGASRVLRRVRE